MTHEEFTVLETLHRDDHNTVLRALRRDGSSVVLKVLDSRRCREKDLARLRREYEVGASLDLDSSVRPCGLEIYEGMPALVLEDFGGEPLERLAMPLPPERFLDLAVRIAGAVADVHDHGVVHKDLNPANVLVDPTTLQVKIADFGIATRLRREQQAPRPPQLIEGSLPYMSPEQTGRMNRAVDSRTDLYSLGVTFYRMLTGRLPFEARDPLEWVHCHLARVPASPSHIAPEVPEAISRIVMKLLAKIADDRYQTARGLEHDLATCLASWQRRGRVDPFPLGERDVPDRLQVPQRLYGREEPGAALLRAFERVAKTGSPELVLVSGYSGIGKSSLVHELQKPIVGRRGLFATGKFDQYKRDVPYSTIAQAFREMVLDLLVEGEGGVDTWRQRLQAALGANGQLVVDVIPQVELLVGKQPPVPELPLSEATNRFYTTFRRFLGAFAREEHPLTLFLDDLQWSDAASLELLADVLVHPETRHLLVIGAYRDNEVAEGHPLMVALDGVRRSGSAIHEIVLAPLSGQDLGQLVADAMRRPAAEVARLARLVEEKTAGNPYFAIQFLTSLEDDGLLRLDPADLAWRCDIDSVRARGYADNVVDLMVAKLRRLSQDAQEAVKLAACGGNATEAATLSELRARSEEETHRDLWELVREGLLLRSGDTYRFSHDRVQQAAYALIPEDDRPKWHVALGRLLLARTPAEQLGEKVFEIVNQLNRGARWIEDPSERWRLAELDLVAGRRAKAGAAYGAACEVLAAGMAMLPGDAWETRRDLTYDLHFERAQCEYLQGNFAEAERCLALLMLHARSLAEKADCHRLRIDVYTTRGDLPTAVENLLQCLGLFGIAIERHPRPEMAQQRYAELMQVVGTHRIGELVDLPPMSDRDVRALLEALVAALPAAHFWDMQLCFAILIEAVRLSIAHGNAPISAVAYGALGVNVGPLLGKYRDGYEFGKVGVELVQRRGLVAHRTETSLHFGMCTLWIRHLGADLPLLEEGLRTGAETGQLNYASYCAYHLGTMLLARGDALAEVDRRSRPLLEFVRGARYSDVEDMILSQRRLVHSLRGLSSAAVGDPRSGDLDARIQCRIPLAVCSYQVHRMQEAFLLGDPREALSVAIRARDVRWATAVSWESCDFSFYRGLTLAALHADARPREREEHRRELRDELERHRVWADNCPENFRDRHALLSAELARVEGRELDAEGFYEQAIRSAREHGFVQNEALAYDLASRFYRARGFDLTADAYLREARARYLRWGADAKVKQLERLHPQLVDERPLAPTSTFAVRSEQLDLLSVVKASQTISGEVEVERLVGTLLEVALEHGGARKGHLALERDGGLFIEAEATLEEHGVATRVLPSLAVESSTLVPASVLQFAKLSREPVILADAASQPGKFAADPYLSRQRPRSVLCLPILRQSTLVGLLYLENVLVPGVFTPDRLTALSVLASQAAISMENALLLARERAARVAAEEARAAVEEAERRSAFLAEAGALLSESLEYERTLSQLCRISVRSLADWCVLDLLEEGGLRRLAGACAQASQESLLEQLKRLYQARPGSPHPAARCLLDAKPVWLAEVDDELLRSLSENDEHFQIVRALGTRSVLSVPLAARTTTLGVLTLASSTPGRYGREDLELAQEVARRAAMAIENARLYREAQEGIRVREEFLSVASHELRTPTAGLMLSAEALAASAQGGRALDPASTRKLLDLLVRQGRRLSRLVGDLLDATRLRKPLSLELAEIELGTLVREVVSRLSPDLAMAGCHVCIEAGGPVVGRWDRSRLDQVITNLLSNAMKFGRGKPVEISVGTQGDHASLAIRDRGIGIGSELQPRLFGGFERGVSASHYGGLGLGLYICRGIVEAHGGSIRVESQPGAGATFKVELPCTGSGAAPQA